jgi:hypothetical protein
MLNGSAESFKQSSRRDKANSNEYLMFKLFDRVCDLIGSIIYYMYEIIEVGSIIVNE